jgi:hypothetical protein
MAFRLTARATRTTFLTPARLSAHTLRGPMIPPINAYVRQPNQHITNLMGILKRLPKSLIIVELLATAGTVAFGNEDVVAMGQKGVSTVKKAVERVLEKGMGGKVVVKREDGKWSIRMERKK